MSAPRAPNFDFTSARKMKISNFEKRFRSSSSESAQALLGRHSRGKYKQVYRLKKGSKLGTIQNMMHHSSSVVGRLSRDRSRGRIGRSGANFWRHRVSPLIRIALVPIQQKIGLVLFVILEKIIRYSSYKIDSHLS